jgi:adenylate kinase
MVKSRLSAEDAQTYGWLLDGYPRSASQAEAIEAADIRPDVFILINVRVDDVT